MFGNRYFLRNPYTDNLASTQDLKTVQFDDRGCTFTYFDDSTVTFENKPVNTGQKELSAASFRQSILGQLVYLVATKNEIDRDIEAFERSEATARKVSK